jgi:heptosyltransferase III
MNSILVVRRDNIGDLVCTTPLFHALRRRFPQAWIGALVNSYNAPVLDRNPHIDGVFVYTKFKHLESGQSKLGALRRRLADLWTLRRKSLDCVVVATPAGAARTLRLARLLGPRRIVVGAEAMGGMHEVERVYALAPELGIAGPIPPLEVFADESLVARAQQAFAGARQGGLRVGLQISARRPAQRWPLEHFAALVRHLDAVGARPMLLWAPGTIDHPRHPGDDHLAAALTEQLGDKLIAYRTGTLPELIGALAACEAVITSDGGAMHLAAALRKAIVCFFGDVSPERWRPWGVPHRALRAASGRAADISVDETLVAFRELVQLA